MNRKLTLLFAAGVSASAFAVDKPYIIPDAAVLGFSPDNSVAVSQVGSSVFFFDLNSDEAPKIFSESEDGMIGYNIGNGNFMSNNTILVYRSEYGPSIWRWSAARGVHNGRWSNLETDMTMIELGTPNGVTADGSRICGNASTGAAFGLEESKSMTTPCIWDYNDGNITRTLLPSPDTDYCGLAPQYRTALAISDNGRTIIGQSVSNSGFFCEYLLYKQNADGSWSCTSPFADRINPNKLVHPEYPAGEAPAVPSPEAFLDEAGKQAYDKAYEDYIDGLGDEPDVRSYLTADSIAAYNRQIDIVNAWAVKYNAWREVDDQILSESDSFVFNQGSISPNGKFFVASISKSYINSNQDIYTIYTPVLYDIEEGKTVSIPTDKSILVTSVSDLGDIIGYERRDEIDFGYALPAGATEWVPLEKYVVDRNPDLAEWVESNWKHQVQVIVDEEENIVELQELYISGLPIMSRDFSHLSTVAYHFWTDGPEELYNRFCSSIIPLGSTRGAINEIATSPAAETDNAWYNLQGRRIANPSAPGIYIHQGRKVVVKN